MAKADYVSIGVQMPPEGTSPKVLVDGKRRGRILVGSKQWEWLVNANGDKVCWKAHSSEGGPPGDVHYRPLSQGVPEPGQRVWIKFAGKRHGQATVGDPKWNRFSDRDDFTWMPVKDGE